jgi:hypothetical protein
VLNNSEKLARVTGASSARQASMAKDSQGPWRPASRGIGRQSVLLVGTEEEGGRETKKELEISASMYSL